MLEHVFIANSDSCNMACTICSYGIADDLFLPVIGSIVIGCKIVVAKIYLHIYFGLSDGFKLRKQYMEINQIGKIIFEAALTTNAD